MGAEGRADGNDPSTPLLDPPPPGALFLRLGPEPRAADRPAALGHHRGDRPRLGDELVLRYRELGGRDLELLGRGADGFLREAMVRAALARGTATSPGQALAITPERVSRGGDFSFIVIGDTGEGDASQHSLRDQYLQVVRKEEVKFVVVSSDVVYPAGAMRDYEAKFWLPFMGTTKPVYAIPGNHDWYDALEGFAATFLQPDAAQPPCAHVSRPTTG